MGGVLLVKGHRGGLDITGVVHDLHGVEPRAIGGIHITVGAGETEAS
jgi:hypothetical protein